MQIHTGKERRVAISAKDAAGESVPIQVERLTAESMNPEAVEVENNGDGSFTVRVSATYERIERTGVEDTERTYEHNQYTEERKDGSDYEEPEPSAIRFRYDNGDDPAWESVEAVEIVDTETPVLCTSISVEQDTPAPAPEVEPSEDALQQPVREDMRS